MRMVVDSNYLQTEELRAFLAASKENSAVITDYAAMDAYKGDTLVSIPKSMAILCAFPDQVIVLKDTLTIARMLDQCADPQERMIDWSQTKSFGAFCQMVHRAENGDARVQAEMLRYGADATARMDQLLNAGTQMASAITGLLDTFTENELRALRKKETLSIALTSKIVNNIFRIVERLLRFQMKLEKPPAFAELLDSYVLRLAVSYFAWVLGFVAGPPPTSPKRVRNDTIDITYAAYATFFDGLLSKDELPIALYQAAMQMMQVLRSGPRAT
jgi:hypothetical protein